jgi:hypothetical protein
MLLFCLYDVFIVVSEKYLMMCFYDLAAMSTACIDSMIESVAWNEAPCVMSPILLMCGSITSVVKIYIHTYKHFSRGLLSDLAWWMKNMATVLLGRFCTACI